MTNPSTQLLLVILAIGLAWRLYRENRRLLAENETLRKNESVARQCMRAAMQNRDELAVKMTEAWWRIRRLEEELRAYRDEERKRGAKGLWVN